MAKEAKNAFTLDVDGITFGPLIREERTLGGETT